MRANLPRLTVLVTVNMQTATQTLGTTEEYTGLGRRMELPDTTENHVPVGTTKVGRCAQTGDGVLVGVRVVNHDVGSIVGFDLGRQVRVDLNALVDVLGLDGEQQRTEPLEGAKVTANPEEVDLGKAGLGLRVVHAVPDRLENGSKGRDTNTSTDEDRDLVLEHVLGSGAEGAVDVDTGEHTAEGGVDIRVVAVDADDVGPASLLVPLTTQRLRNGTGEVTHHTHVDGNVVLFRSAGQCEGVVLPDGHLGAVEENVLASLGRGVLLLDLDLAHIAGVLDHLGNIGLVSATHLTSDTLGKVNEASVHPVLPEHTDSLRTNGETERRDVGLNHAESTVDGPEHKEDDEHVMRIPETLVVSTSRLLHASYHHAGQGQQHDVAGPTRSRHQVGQEEAVNSQVVLGGNLSQVVPVGNSVDPAEEENRPGRRNMKGDVLVELDDTVKWGLTSQGDERSADREQHHGDVEV